MDEDFSRAEPSIASTALHPAPRSWHPYSYRSTEPEHGPPQSLDTQPNNPGQQEVSEDLVDDDEDLSLDPLQSLITLFTSPSTCSYAQHYEQLDDHRQTQHECGRACEDLAAATSAKLPDRLSIFQPATSASFDYASLQLAFEGGLLSASREQTPPPCVCLHVEEEAYGPKIPAGFTQVYDVDSCIGLAKGLGAIKGGLQFYGLPPERQNITSDLHVSFPLNDGSEETFKPHQLRHLFFGTHASFTSIGIWIFFPNMPTPVSASSSNALSRQHLSQWYDEILLPALDDLHMNDVSQHIAASFDHSVAQCEARHYEGRASKSAVESKMQYLSYALAEEHLASLWEAMNRFAARPGLHHFQGMQIMVSFKNLKSITKQPTPDRCISRFLERFEAAVNLDQVYRDHLYFDLAMEVTPEASNAKATYMWRRCCLQRLNINHFGAGPRGGSTTHAKIFHHAFLRDACNMTVTFPPSHRFAEAGAVYLQAYSVVKGVFDAAKKYPFGKEELEELGIDPRYRAAVQAEGRSSRDLAVLWDNYGHSKTRLATSIRDSEAKTFGVRLELRLKHGLLLQLQQRLCNGGRNLPTDRAGLSMPSLGRQPSPPAPFRDRHPKYAWALSTERFLRLVRYQANKCCNAFEVITSMMKDRKSVPLGACQLSIALLQTLRLSVVAADYHDSRALWISDRRLPPDRERQGRGARQPAAHSHRAGLGLEQTIEEFGIGWWIPHRVLWEKLEISRQYSQAILFNNRTLLDAHRKRHQQVLALDEAHTTLDQYGRWLTRFGSHPDNLHDIYLLMAHRLLQQYRDNVEWQIRDHKKPGVGDRLDNFSVAGLRKTAPGVQVSPVSSPRARYHRPLELFALLWGDVDRDTPLSQHLHYHNIGFRAMYRQVRDSIRRTVGPQALDTFQDILFVELATYHWIYPWPERSNGNIVARTKNPSLRMVWYIQRGIPLKPNERECLSDDTVFPWHWGKARFIPGLAPSLPTWLARSTEEWRRVFRGRLERSV